MLEWVLGMILLGLFVWYVWGDHHDNDNHNYYDD